MIEEINLQDWELSGEGAEGQSYNNKADSNLLLKLYREDFNSTEVEKEQEISQIVYGLGINTPEPGKIVSCGRRKGLIFRRIQNKKSFCRAAGDDLSRLDEMARKLALEAKALHTMPVDPKAKLDDYREADKELIAKCKMSNGRRKLLNAFLDKAPAPDCYMHGDFHFGNIITDGQKNYFIDLSRFGLGTADYDICMFAFVVHYTPNFLMKRNFHMDKHQAMKFYETFLKYYYPDPKELKAHKKIIKKWEVFKADYVNLMIGDPKLKIFMARGHIFEYLFEKQILMG